MSLIGAICISAVLAFGIPGVVLFVLVAPTLRVGR